MTNHGYWLYWYNPQTAKTGYTEYTTNSIEKAIALFYRDFTTEYEILNIHE